MEDLSIYESFETSNYLEREEVEAHHPASFIAASVLTQAGIPVVRQRLIEPIPSLNDLLEAIHGGDLGEVRALLRRGADPNGADPFGTRPLCLSTTPEMVQLLIEHGADPNLGGEDSPLNYALRMDKFELAEQMIRSGATLSLSRGEWKRSGDREYLLQKGVAHACSIKGSIQLTPKGGGESDPDSGSRLEGGFPQDWIPEIVGALTELERESQSGLTHEEISPMRQALLSAKSTERSGEELLTLYREGKPILIVTGFPRHVVTVLIVGDKLFICNRGAANRGSVEAYRFNPEKLDAALIEQMALQPSRASYESTFFHQVPEQLECVRDEELQARSALPMQTIGNCSYANMEAAVYSYLHAIDHPRARELFDSFSLRVRSSLFGQLLEAAKEGDYELNMDLAIRAAAQIGPEAQAALSQFQKSSTSGTWGYLKAIARTGHLRQLWS